MRLLSACGGVILVGLLFLSTQVGAQARLTFQTEQVTSNVSVDEFATIAIDSNLMSHIAFSQGGYYGDIIYATIPPLSPWILTNLTNSPGVREGHPSIAVDPWDRVHIAYETETSIVYATNGPGTWSHTTVAPGRWPCLVVAPTGRIFIAHERGGTGPWITHGVGGAFFSAQITAAPLAAPNYSMAVDRFGDLHLAWVDTPNLVYSHCTVVQGFIQCDPFENVVLAYDGTLLNPSITVDGWARPAVAYSTFSATGTSPVLWANKNGGSWASFEVDSDTGSLNSAEPTISLAGDGTPRILYRDETDLLYAAPGFSSWISTSASDSHADAYLAVIDRVFTIDMVGRIRYAFRFWDQNDSEIVHGYTIDAVGPLPASCAVPLELGCNTQVMGFTSGRQSLMTTYDCSAWTESGPESVYSFTLTAPTTDVTATISDIVGGDLDVFVLSTSGCSASPQCLGPSAVGNLSVSLTDVPAGTYYVVVDGYNGAEGQYNITLTCSGDEIFSDGFELGLGEWSSVTP